MKLKIIEPYPSECLIGQIEELLDDAKSGLLQGLVYVRREKGDRVCHGWAGIGSHRKRIIGELEDLKLDILMNKEPE